MKLLRACITNIVFFWRLFMERLFPLPDIEPSLATKLDTLLRHRYVVSFDLGFYIVEGMNMRYAHPDLQDVIDHGYAHYKRSRNIS